MDKSPPPLRIIHATECLAAGTLQVMRALAGVLDAAGAAQVILYSRREESPPDVAAQFPAAVRLIEVPPARGNHAAFVRGFTRALRHECAHWAPTHVHLHSSKAGFVGRFALRRQSQLKVLYSPHGLSFLDNARPVANALRYGLERMASQWNATPVACGTGEGELLAKLTQRRAFVLENPVDDAFFSVSDAARQGRTVVTVGRISRQKAPERFAEMARRVLALHPDVRFVWVGDGDPHGRAQLEAAGCEVTGWVDKPGVLDHLARADVYLQTSRWEGMPLSVIQAMAAGLPCIVTDVVGNRDAVEHGVSGYVVASEVHMAEHTVALLDDETARRTLGKASRLTAKNRFSAEVFAARVRALYGLVQEPEPGALPYLNHSSALEKACYGTPA